MLDVSMNLKGQRYKMETCNGCLTHNHEYHECVFLIADHIYDPNKCPCRICLIKVMCNEICGTYKKYQTDEYTKYALETY